MQHIDKKTAYDSVAAGLDSIRSKLEMVCSYNKLFQFIKNDKSSTCCSAVYMSQKCYTISEVPADWHELMIPWCSVPSIARTSEQLDPRSAASRHTTTQVSHIGPLSHTL